jgi:hypothetical protein
MIGWTAANPNAAAGYVATVPLGRIGDCEADIGEGVAMLCSPMAPHRSLRAAPRTDIFPGKSCQYVRYGMER